MAPTMAADRFMLLSNELDSLLRTDQRNPPLTALFAAKRQSGTRTETGRHSRRASNRIRNGRKGRFAIRSSVSTVRKTRHESIASSMQSAIL
jgi:hypothetical protein